MIKKILSFSIVFTITLSIFFLIESCTTTALMIQSTPNLTPYNSIKTNGNNTHPAIIRLINSEDLFFCTGFVIDGIYAMTAAHCVINTSGIMSKEQIHIYDSYRNATGLAIPVAINKYLDIAFIQGNFENYKPLPVDFVGKHSKRGMAILSCGFPAGMFDMYCAELIHVGNYNFEYKTRGGPIYKGMSGGPAIEATSGEVVGINSGVDINSVIIAPVIGALESVGLK